MISRRAQHSVRFLPILVLSGVGAVQARASAQCSTQWLQGHAVPGTDGPVHATTVWDPDGPGAMRPVLVVGGAFAVAGTVVANNIATYDPLSGAWSALGSGISGGMSGIWVNALTTLPNGDLVAGGKFTTAGGVSANCIARWNGASWSALGAGMGGAGSTVPEVFALTALPNGDVVAGGAFTTAGGVSASYIARWNGTSWWSLGAGMNGYVNALATLPNGEVVAGGWFSSAGGIAANQIARWNGTSWSSLGTGMSGSLGATWVQALARLPNGDLVAGGFFTGAGGVICKGIARWNGASWSALGTGFAGFPVAVRALSILTNGDLVAAGQFSTAGSVSADNIARWDGRRWSALGAGILASDSVTVTVKTVATLPNGDVVAGGAFTTAGGVAATNVARWDGEDWSELALGTSASVHAFAQLPNGDLVLGGDFTTVAGVKANCVARWDGASWSPLGPGMSSSVVQLTSVDALTSLPNGDLVAAGCFTGAGGSSANNIARWDGTSWLPLGSGISDGVVLAVTTLPNGDVVAAGQFSAAGGGGASNIALWNGTGWSALGSELGGANFRVNALTTLQNGNVVAGGSFAFSTVGGSILNIARWDGTNWSAMGSGMSDQVHSLLTLPNGDLVAGGSFTTAGGVNVDRIARWNGTGWSALGSGMNGPVLALTILPNGDLVAGGGFTTAGGVSADKIARWNGTSWSALSSGTTSGGKRPSVYCLTTLPNGSLFAGGEFTIVSGAVSAYVAELTTTCPAAAIRLGTGCTGSGGPNALTATTLPWAGATFRSNATGMPALGLAIDVRGLNTAAIPMPAILPQGVPGCTLLVSPDLLDLLVPVAGGVQTEIVIPSSMALANQIFHQQIAALELDPLGNITALTSSNALSLTIGFL